MIVAAAVAAAATRAASPDTDVERLVDDAADGCPGLVVDRYGPVLRIELRGRRWPQDAGALAAALVDAAPGAAHAVGLLRLAGGRSELRVLAGAPPASHVVHEDGVRLLVRTVDEDAAGVGVFVDHREGRALVRARAAGGRVLNLFAHAGAFGAASVVGGAARVDHVDAARKCAPWAALNLALNGEDPRKHRFVVDDALAFVAKAARKGPAYDIVVCDPPTTAVRPDGTRFHVEDDLKSLAADCVRALVPGGALLLSTNDRALRVDDVAALAREGARAAGATFVSVDEIPLPSCVPSATFASDPTLRPMRGVWCLLQE